ncbi:MAG: 3-keto-disaccharide hydrolase [Planctomycetaceae bacterium]
MAARNPLEYRLVPAANSVIRFSPVVTAMMYSRSSRRTFLATAASFSLLLSTAQGDEPKTAEKDAAGKRSLFDGKTLKGWKEVSYGGEGKIKVENGTLIIGAGDPMTGIVFDGDVAKLPTRNYELELEAMRVDGGDFFCGLTFPVGDSHCSFIVGGWGGGVVGLSSINGMDASENETTKYLKVDSDKWYKLRVRVSGDRIQTWIDKEQYAKVVINKRKISTRVEVNQNKPLGISTYHTTGAIRNFTLRELTAEEIAAEPKPTADE